LILSCYEAMSGMKINFERSEVFSVGLLVDEQQQTTAILGCKIGTFPIKYLGMPVGHCKITKAQLRYVSDKAKKRLGTWQCDHLSSGGKSTLIESCLSSIPMLPWVFMSSMRVIINYLIPIDLNFFGKAWVRKGNTI